MILKEIRHEGKNNRLLFKVLIEEDALIISTKCRDSNEPIFTDIKEIVRPYVDSNTMEKISATCKMIYSQKMKEIQKLP